MTIGAARPAGPYDAFVLDCDGVILDSNAAKSRAFRSIAIASGVGEHIAEAFSEWQRANFGTSRFRVFARLVAGDFGPVPADLSIHQLLNSFAEAVDAIYLTAPECRGLGEFFAATEGRPLFVASGSEETQLRTALARRGIAQRFRGVYGSPTPKNEILGEIAARLRAITPGIRILMIGDAHADAEAATHAGVDFAFFRPYSTVAESMHARALRDGFPVVDSLADLATSWPAESSDTEEQ